MYFLVIILSVLMDCFYDFKGGWGSYFTWLFKGFKVQFLFTVLGDFGYYFGVFGLLFWLVIFGNEGGEEENSLLLVACVWV